MKVLISCAMAMAMVCGMSGQVSAALIAGWTYETSIPTTAGPHLAEAGLQAGIAASTGFHATGVTTYNNPVGNGSNESFSSNNWTTIGDYYQFQVNLTGYSNATITFDQARSSTGPGDFSIQISTNGTTFSTIGSYTVLVNANPAAGPGAWTSSLYNPAYTFGPISLTAALDNQPTAYVRLRANVTAAPAGTNRIDNVGISAVPEPTTLSLLGSAIVGMTLVRRRR